MIRVDIFPMQTNLSHILDGDVDLEVAKLASTGIRIPPQPQIVLEVQRMAQSDDMDLRSMADLISHDAGLTAMLFKLTRSAAFKRGRPPLSMESIISMLGIRQTAQLVQAYGLTVAVSGDTKLLQQFWARSNSIAQLAAIIAAERVKVCNIFPEQAYLAGLFHDCGVPVLMARFPDYCKATGLNAVTHKWADVRNEDRNFQVDHCSIGYLLARHWRLPGFVAEAILHHHDWGQEKDPASRSVIAILQLAIELFSQDQALANPDWSVYEQTVIEELGLHPDDLLEFSDEVMDAYRANLAAS